MASPMSDDGEQRSDRFQCHGTDRLIPPLQMFHRIVSFIFLIIKQSMRFSDPPHFITSNLYISFSSSPQSIFNSIFLVGKQTPVHPFQLFLSSVHDNLRSLHNRCERCSALCVQFCDSSRNDGDRNGTDRPLHVAVRWAGEVVRLEM
jgi:hypothetical protein